MSALANKTAIRIAILALAIVAPFALPAFQVELTFLWIMIVFALSWDIMGGQAGYNSFGNIAFFGIGVYAATIVQIGLFHDVAAYTAAATKWSNPPGETITMSWPGPACATPISGSIPSAASPAPSPEMACSPRHSV